MKIDELLRNKYWMPSNLNFNDMLFEEISERTLKDSPFLDSRAVRKTGRTIKIPINHLLEKRHAISPENSLNHIFHISHVGSTFVARLFDTFFEVDVFREPPIFKGIASLCREAQHGVTPFSAEELSVLYDLICRLLMRGRKNAIVKHSSQNLIIPDFAETTESEPKPVLFIFTSLINFLCHGLSSSGAQGDAMNGADARIKFFNQVSTLDTVALVTLSKIQLIALIWVVEMIKILNRFDERRGDELFNFDKVLETQDRITIIESLSKTFHLPISVSKSTDIKSDSIWETNSKGLSLGGFEKRKQNIEKTAVEQNDLISEGVEWVQSLCNRNVMFRSLSRYIE
jgi:hypothetical protein